MSLSKGICLAGSLAALSFGVFAGDSQVTVGSSGEKLNSVIAQQARIESLNMLFVIDYINNGDVRGLCDFAKMNLKNNMLIIGPKGVSVSLSADKKKNDAVYKRAATFFSKGGRCSYPRK